MWTCINIRYDAQGYLLTVKVNTFCSNFTNQNGKPSVEAQMTPTAALSYGAGREINSSINIYIHACYGWHASAVWGIWKRGWSISLLQWEQKWQYLGPVVLKPHHVMDPHRNSLSVSRLQKGVIMAGHAATATTGIGWRGGTITVTRSYWHCLTLQVKEAHRNVTKMSKPQCPQSFSPKCRITNRHRK